ncbi:MAG TPA: MFS transporter [Terriglobales bacterium]|nr:MFS transporter [Terriglobales bacterium]
MSTDPGTIRLGVRENLGQFSLLVLINAFVGMMVGLERTVVPLIGEREFGLVSKTAIVSFIVSFGVTKAICNLFAARVSETVGRKKVLVTGWLIGLPVPFIIIFAHHWYWFNAANVLLGINQALCWSMTVIMKVDLAGPKRRGLALGLNEFAGYIAVGFTAWITGYIASMYALRPQPFYLGIGVAFAGLLLSFFFAKETRQYALLEAKLHHNSATDGTAAATNTPMPQTMREVLALASWRDRNLFSCSQAGLVNNLNDGMSWGIYPLFFASFGLSVAAIGTIKAVYPAAWGILQLLTGPLSDRWGRKWLIAGGMIVQASGIWLTVQVPVYTAWMIGALLQGIGTAMVYPTLLAAIGDVAHPEWRASAMGAYRFWRDLGYALGALISGVIADLLGMRAAIQVVAVLTLLSGLHVAIRMRETHSVASRQNVAAVSRSVD